MSAAHPGDPVEPRLALLGADEAAARAEAAGVPGYLTRLSIFRVLLHHPPLAKAMSDVLGLLLFEGTLDRRLRELMIMRIGWATGSVYEWTQHWHIAGALGVADDDLLGVRDWRAHGSFGPAERAVLQAVDDVVDGGALNGETWSALQAHVSADPVVLLEVVAVIGLWRLVSEVLQSLVVPLEPEVDPWPPDGMGPPE